MLVTYPTHSTQHVPQNKANVSLCYVPVSFMQTEYFGATLQPMRSTCVLIVCCFQLLNLSQLMWLGAVGHTQKGTCNLHNKFEELEVDHIGHNFAPKYCCLKLAGSIMNDWLHFMAHVGLSKLDV